MKIVIADADTVTNGDITFERFEKFGEVEVYSLLDEKEIIEKIEDADIVICNKIQLNSENLKTAKKLKYIGLFATGYNNIDIDYAHEHDICVCNVPGYSTEAVAQHTFAFILALINKVGEYNKTVKQGDWIKSRTFTYFPLPTFELAGKTIGIVGYGTIGRRVGDIARAFNMNVLVYNRHAVNDDSVKQVTLDELLKNSDIVTLHCPLNDDSKNMMNEETFVKMKQGALFINTARGGAVDELALKNALESGHLAGAGIDVLKSEPMEKDCPLCNVQNCYITPHVAWAGLETRKRLLDIVEDNISAFLSGKPQNRV